MEGYLMDNKTKNIYLCFDNKNVNKIFLSPYCLIKENNDEIVIYQYLFNTALHISGDKENIFEFINKLQRGLTLDHILNLLKQLNIEDPNQWVKVSMQKGMLE